jgi:hypothetical protein
MCCFKRFFFLNLMVFQEIGKLWFGIIHWWIRIILEELVVSQLFRIFLAVYENSWAAYRFRKCRRNWHWNLSLSFTGFSSFCIPKEYISDEYIFCDMIPCSPLKFIWRFVRTFRPHLQGISRAICQRKTGNRLVLRPWRRKRYFFRIVGWRWSFPPKCQMNFNRLQRTLRNHRCQNLKPYKYRSVSANSLRMLFPLHVRVYHQSIRLYFSFRNCSPNH